MKAVPLLAAGLFYFLLSSSASALSAVLNAPEVAMFEDYPRAAKVKFNAALSHPDCKFVRGFAVNWHTTLLYAGDTQALNTFLKELAECPGVTVGVSFVKELPEEGCLWRVTHDGKHNMHVFVSLLGEQIKLGELKIPPAKGPPWVHAKGLKTSNEVIETPTNLNEPDGCVKLDFLPHHAPFRPPFAPRSLVCFVADHQTNWAMEEGTILHKAPQAHASHLDVGCWTLNVGRCS